MNLKNAKSGFISARVHVDAMWHSGPHGSATRAHAALTRKMRCAIIYIYIYILYSV